MPVPDDAAISQSLPILQRAEVDSRVVAVNSFGSEYAISRVFASRSTRLTQSNPAVPAEDSGLVYCEPRTEPESSLCGCVGFGDSSRSHVGWS
jgi:hypothetical protein